MYKFIAYTRVYFCFRSRSAAIVLAACCQVGLIATTTTSTSASAAASASASASACVYDIQLVRRRRRLRRRFNEIKFNSICLFILCALSFVYKAKIS